MRALGLLFALLPLTVFGQARSQSSGGVNLASTIASTVASGGTSFSLLQGAKLDFGGSNTKCSASGSSTITCDGELKATVFSTSTSLFRNQSDAQLVIRSEKADSTTAGMRFDLSNGFVAGHSGWVFSAISGTGSQHDILAVDGRNGKLTFQTTDSSADAAIGTATLSGGSVTVSTTAVTANSKIFLTHAGSATTNAGVLYVGTVTAATSFVINSKNASDSDTVNWIIFN